MTRSRSLAPQGRVVALATCLGAALASLGGCAHPALHAAGPLATLSAADGASFESTLLLIGDAGDPRANSGGRTEPVLRAAAAAIRAARGHTAVVFLGDNVYPTGFPASDARDTSAAVRRAQRILDTQLRFDGGGVADSVPRWFVPGNHDWGDNGAKTSLFGVPHDAAGRIAAQGAFLADEARRGPRVELMPSAGCPGPEVRDVGRWLRVIAIDTQWWLQNLTLPNGACGTVTTRDSAVAALRRALADAHGRRTIVVAHHPLASAGPHGGWYGGVAQIIAPLRLAAGWLTGRQDLSNRKNVATRHAIEDALRDAHPLAYASGHEHTLQVFRGGVADWYLVSGAGIYGHDSPVRCRRASTFAAPGSGFMRLDVTPNGDVRLRVVTVDLEGVPAVRYERWLTESATADAQGGENC